MNSQTELDSGNKFPPAGAIAIYLHSSRAATRCALLLFSACILIVFAAWVLNRSVEENESEGESRMGRSSALVRMLEQVRAYQSLDRNLFENLAFTALTKVDEEGRRSPLRVATVIADGRFVDRTISVGSSSDLFDQAKRFGAQAESIFKKGFKRSDRSRLLNQAIQESFNQDDARMLLSERALYSWANIDAPEEWNGIVDWMVFGEWPPQGGAIARRVLERPQVSYAVSFRGFRQWQPVMAWVLRTAGGPAKAEKLIESQWEQESGSLAQFGYTPPKLTIGGTGLSVRADDLLLLAAPLLTMLQIVFFLLHERELSLQKKLLSGLTLDARATLSSFPAYGCPRDPLQLPRVMGEAAERATYLLFLVLPIAILCAGLLTRYDLTWIKAGLRFNRGRDTWLDLLTAERFRSDPLSSFLDYVTLTCLALSLFMVFCLTRPNKQEQDDRHTKKISQISKLLAFVPMALCVGAWLRWLRHFAVSYGPFLESGYLGAIRRGFHDSLPILLFAVLSACFFAVAIPRGAKLTSIVSGIGIVLFLCLLLKP